MDLYFKRHDGQAVTCDDFLAAMADANGQDLSTVARWSVPMFARANPNQHAFVGNSWCKGLISLECVEPCSTHYSVLCCKSSGSSAIHIRLHVCLFNPHLAAGSSIQVPADARALCCCSCGFEYPVKGDKL